MVELTSGPLRLDFDLRLNFQFRSDRSASVARLAANREFNGGVGLTGTTGEVLSRFETGRLIQPESLAVLSDLFGRWLDTKQDEQPPSNLVMSIAVEGGAGDYSR